MATPSETSSDKNVVTREANTDDDHSDIRFATSSQLQNSDNDNDIQFATSSQLQNSDNDVQFATSSQLQKSDNDIRLATSSQLQNSVERAMGEVIAAKKMRVEELKDNDGVKEEEEEEVEGVGSASSIVFLVLALNPFRIKSPYK